MDRSISCFHFLSLFWRVWKIAKLPPSTGWASQFEFVFPFLFQFRVFYFFSFFVLFFFCWCWRRPTFQSCVLNFSEWPNQHCMCTINVTLSRFFQAKIGIYGLKTNWLMNSAKIVIDSICVSKLSKFLHRKYDPISVRECDRSCAHFKIVINSVSEIENRTASHSCT